MVPSGWGGDLGIDWKAQGGALQASTVKPPRTWNYSITACPSMVSGGDNAIGDATKRSRSAMDRRASSSTPTVPVCSTLSLPPMPQARAISSKALILEAYWPLFAAAWLRLHSSSTYLSLVQLDSIADSCFSSSIRRATLGSRASLEAVGWTEVALVVVVLYAFL